MKNKKMVSSIMAGSILVANMPIHVFANDIDVIIENQEVGVLEEEVLLDEEVSGNVDVLEDVEGVKEEELEDSADEDIEAEIEGNLESLMDDIAEETEESVSLKEDVSALHTEKSEKVKYVISDLDGLKDLRDEVNNNNLDTSGMLIELGADIDFSGETGWTAIGTAANGFKGILDGKGYSFKNLTITSGDFEGIFSNTGESTYRNLDIMNFNITTLSSSSYYLGVLVGISSGNVNFENMNLVNININSSSSNIGGLIGFAPNNKVSLKNVNFDGAITGSSSTRTIGGLLGRGYGSFVGIKSSLEANGDSSSIGGVIGYNDRSYNDPNSFVENVEVNINVASASIIGGVIGESFNFLEMNNVQVEGGEINSKASSGGAIGYLNGSGCNPTIKNIKVSINEIISNGNAGGLVGKVGMSNSVVDISNFKVKGKIQGDSFAGGVTGYSTCNLLITNANISDNLISSSKGIAGGIVGYASESSSISNTEVTSVITSQGKAGGIVGNIFGGLIAIDNVVKVDVTSNSEAGGIVAYSAGSNSLIENNELSGNVTGLDSVGGLCGQITGNNGKVIGNVVKVEINGRNQVGGIIGNAPNSTSIENNIVDVVMAANNEVGGVVGYSVGSLVKSNKIKSKIIANDSVGGISGMSMNPNTIYSKNEVTTEISAVNKVGGVTGESYPIKMDNNLVLGSLEGQSRIGGLMGYMNGSSGNMSTVKDCVLAIAVDGQSLGNPVIGELKDLIDIENVYYDGTISPGKDVYGESLSTLQMQGKEAYKNLNLNFNDIWKANKDFYPTFEQKNSAPDIIPTQKVVNSTITITQYEDFNPLDYITVEDFEGDKVAVDIRNNIDTSKYGSFAITYIATDVHGLSSELQLNVKINPATVKINNAPIINANDVEVYVGNKFNPLDRVTAVDKEDGDRTKYIKVVKNTVNTSKVGEYKVVYEVSDKDGSVTVKEIKVTVRAKANTSENGDTNLGGSGGSSNNYNKDNPQTGDEGYLGMLGGMVLMLCTAFGLARVNNKRNKQ